MRIDGAIFDLDGTLTDSMHLWDEAPKALVRRYGGQPPEDLAAALKEMGRREASEYLIATFHMDCTPEKAMDDINELVTAAYRDQVPLKPGADRLLRQLAAMGIPCAVATASEVFQAQAALERLGVWDCFRFAVSCIQYGPKTGPDVYLEAARRLGGTPERTIVFEDALHAAQTAKRAGFLVAGVYDPSAESDRAALERVCDWYLPRLDGEAFWNVLHQ